MGSGSRRLTKKFIRSEYSEDEHDRRMHPSPTPTLPPRSWAGILVDPLPRLRLPNFEKQIHSAKLLKRSLFGRIFIAITQVLYSKTPRVLNSLELPRKAPPTSSVVDLHQIWQA